MGVVSWILGNNAAQDNSSQESSMGNPIHFHPDLIATLRSSHQSITAIYSNVIQLIHRQPCDSEAINSKLHEFKVALQNHSFTENVQVHAYLKHKFADEPLTLNFMKNLHKKMNTLCYSVVKFSRRYHNTTFTEDLRRDFIKELDDIGHNIKECVAVKENELYPLYEA